GDRVLADVPVGARAGTLEVQLVGQGPQGPGKLVQVQVQVGQDPPRSLQTHLPPDESNLKTADDAARAMFALLNADRAQAGLQALQWDAQLAMIARDHSADMRD